ncbi:MAG TPA: adenylate/guanylate cyclase domain-containing protein [Solirubrobacterales bacterium]|nr:adenylate/guanylate cyclase domain-containing protein [Solirubrobacterales bacterium]
MNGNAPSRVGSLRRRRGRAMIFVAVAAAALGTIAYATHLMRALELQSVDARFSVRGAQEQPQELVVVQVDDRTFTELGVQWPFPRSLHARLIDRLRQAGAKVIAVDIQFTEPTVPAQDNALIESIERADGVVLSTTEVDARGHSRVFGGEEVVRAIGARAANTVVHPDPGGTIRKMTYEVDGLTSFAVAAAEASTGTAIEPDELEGDGQAWIDFRGPPGTLRQLSYSQVLRGRVPDSELRGKTVVVGASAPSLQDVHPTSTTGDELMSGPELQANAIWTAIHGFPLKSTGFVLTLLLISLMAAAPAAATVRLKPVPALVAAAALGIAYAGLAQLAFGAGLIVPVVYPLLALTLAALGALAVNYVMTSFERQRVHDTFARFVPQAVVADVLARVDDGDLRFGGVRRECTVLFSDLRGFTTFAEELDPDRVIEVLNRYLEEMSDAIMDQGGTLVSYMGDGIMAVFGAPLGQEDHADRALAAAVEMLEERLPLFNRWMAEQGLKEFAMGIGLNSGTVMSGQVGSKRRTEYTAIGDTTNTAARLEGMTKGSGHQIFVADSTRVAQTRKGDWLELVGEREVRGRTHKITVWTLP